MNKTKKIALIVSLPALALLLSGCGKSAPTSQTPAKQEVAKSAPQAPSVQKDPVASPAPQLPPLPANNKQAIDTELTNIDNELNSTDNLVNSADLSDAQLGL